jgi:cytochrome c5
LVAALAAGALGLALLTGCGGRPDGATLVSTRCGTCHTLTIVTTSRQSAAEWDKTVTKMIKRGAQLSESEKTAVVDYPASKYGP